MIITILQYTIKEVLKFLFRIIIIAILGNGQSGTKGKGIAGGFESDSIATSGANSSSDRNFEILVCKLHRCFKVAFWFW